MVFHDGEMNRISRRDPAMPEDNLLGTFRDGPVNRQHLIDNAKQSVKGRLDGVAAVDRDVTVQDFLEHLRVSNQPLAITDQLLQQVLSVALVSMSRTDEVHRNVRVHQDHCCEPIPYPLSISASMRSISLTG